VASGNLGISVSQHALLRLVNLSRDGASTSEQMHTTYRPSVQQCHSTIAARTSQVRYRAPVSDNCLGASRYQRSRVWLAGSHAFVHACWCACKNACLRASMHACRRASVEAFYRSGVLTCKRVACKRAGLIASRRACMQAC
jgi:hypothetical protein